MCGFAGYLDVGGSASRSSAADLVAAMRDTLVHRGPDDGGMWVDPASGIALGSRRLAILDLSPAGHQPMISADGRVVVAYNGELYNFRELRRQLEQAKVRFRGGSDTEVLVEAIARWGLRPTLERANGMFALAVWDAESRTLALARDRLGEKPLYYGWFGRTMLFGSELKALRAHPAFSSTIDRGSLDGFVRHGFVGGERTIFESVRRLPPGSLLSVDQAGRTSGPEHYWEVASVASAGRRTPFTGSRAEAVDAVATLVDESVALRTVADVPVGAFLSGGIDSSTVVAAMCRSSSLVRTFSIGFAEAEFDEAVHSKAVAAHLGTDHTELYVTPADALAVIPSLPRIFDEPFADPSAIPAYLVAQLAKRDVTVALSGDGGDEVFAGYTRHAAVRRLWPWMHRVPPGLRRAASRRLERATPRTLATVGLAQAVLPRRLRQVNPADKLQKLAPLLGAQRVEELHVGMLSLPTGPDPLVRTDDHVVLDAGPYDLEDPVDAVVLADTETYLPDDILTKVDRTAMAVSLETRIPLLDHRLVELAWRLPGAWHWDADGRGKAVLRDVLHRDVPQELVDRPKSGFGVPIGAWLRGPLRTWAFDTLDPVRLEADGFIDGLAARKLLDQHDRGERDWKYVLWALLMFQSWHDQG